MHEELCLYPQEDSLTSYACYMMPCLFSDRNARIDSNPDTVHARGVLSVSIRGYTHELHMLHDAVFALSRERQNRLQSRHDAFMRDRSQVLYVKVLTKYDWTKLGQFFSCSVGRKIRAAARSKWTRDKNFARGKAKIDILQDTTSCRVCFVTGTPESH